MIEYYVLCNKRSQLIVYGVKNEYTFSYSAQNEKGDNFYLSSIYDINKIPFMREFGRFSLPFTKTLSDREYIIKAGPFPSLDINLNDYPEFLI